MEVKHYEGNGRLSVATECNGIIHMTGRTCMPGYYPDIPSGDDVKSQTAGVSIRHIKHLVLSNDGLIVDHAAVAVLAIRSTFCLPRCSSRMLSAILTI